MPCRTLATAGLVLPLLSLAIPLAAQEGLPPYFSVAAGAGVPVGSFASHASSGFDLDGAISFPRPHETFALRLAGMWNAVGTSAVSAKTQIMALTAGLVLNPPNVFPRPDAKGPPTGPYLDLGVGVYNVRQPDSTWVITPAFGREARLSATYSNNLGFDAGWGYRFALGGLNEYVEARYHKVKNSAVAFVPIVFGIDF